MKIHKEILKNLHKEIKMICTTPIKNRLGECGNMIHSHIYNAFSTFVKEYDDTCGYKIELSNNIYEHWPKYAFFKHAHKTKLINKIYLHWLKINDYTS
jgi:hypothetical protein